MTYIMLFGHDIQSNFVGRSSLSNLNVAQLNLIGGCSVYAAVHTRP